MAAGDVAATLLALQHSAGNRAVGRLVAGGRLQRARGRKGTPPARPGGPTTPLSPPPMLKDGVWIYPELTSQPGQPPVWKFPEASRGLPEPRAVTGGFTEAVPEEDALRHVLTPPPSAETASRREVGNWVHKHYEQIQKLLLRNAELLVSESLPKGLIPEYRIPDINVPWSNRLRIDRIDFENGVIYEIKPEHLRQKGIARARLYASEMDRIRPRPGGQKWQYRVVTYDAMRVVKLLGGIRYYDPKLLGLATTNIGEFMANDIAPPPTMPPPLAGPAAPAAATPAVPPTLEPAPAAAAEVSEDLRAFMRPQKPRPPAPAGGGGTTPPPTPPPVKPPPAAAAAEAAFERLPTAAAAEGVEAAATKPATSGVKAGLRGGALAFNVVTSIPGLVLMARDMKIEASGEVDISLGPAELDDAGGTYQLGFRDEWGPWNTRLKIYISGPLQGQEVQLSASEWRAEMGKRAAKYGYRDWKGDFIQGTVPPKIIDPNTA